MPGSDEFRGMEVGMGQEFSHVLAVAIVELPAEVWIVSILASLIPLVVVQIYKSILKIRSLK